MSTGAVIMMIAIGVAVGILVGGVGIVLLAKALVGYGDHHRR